MSDTDSFPYTAYLIRLWPADEQGGRGCRVHLENPRTGERHGFSSLAALVAFLEEETGERVLKHGDETAAAP
ncbi:MAG: hypothetical protein ACE5E7_18210 [Anaerolineae bacterium]